MAAGAMEDDTEELREFRARWIDDLTKRRESAVRLYNAGLALESVGQLREGSDRRWPASAARPAARRHLTLPTGLAAAGRP